jgi:LysR family glycine cleavage system transcriptional activator
VARRAQSLTVSLPASLAANWLVPRLPAFHASHRDIQIELRSMNGHADLDGSDADLAIWPGPGSWSGLRAERLLDMDAYPVCGAEFPARHSELRSVNDLAASPLLGIAGQPEQWPAWLRAAGAAANPARVRQFPSALPRGGLRARRRARPRRDRAALSRSGATRVRRFNVSVKLSKGCYVVCRGSDGTQRPISTFREWLIVQARSGMAAH